MSYPPRVILHAPNWDNPKLDAFVEDCLRAGVVLVCVVGDDCQRVEDIIDEIVVGDGSDLSRFLNTTSHPAESLDEVREFATAWTLDVDPGTPVAEVTLTSN
jgi:hypothetical protein